jgi:hypothetical protein
VATVIAQAKGEQPSKPGGIAAKVEQDLQVQLSEMFFASVRVFVEGLEDLGYISSYLSLLDLWDEFRALGCHVVQVQGKSNLVYALAVAKALDLPSFAVFDADGNTPADDPAKPTGKRTKHEKDNTAIFKLCDIEAPAPFPANTHWGNNVVVWPNQIGQIVEQEIGADEFQKLKEIVCKKYGIYVHDKDKNTLFSVTSWRRPGSKERNLRRLKGSVGRLSNMRNRSSARGNLQMRYRHKTLNLHSRQPALSWRAKMSIFISRKVFIVVAGGNAAAQRHFEDTIQRKRTLEGTSSREGTSSSKAPISEEWSVLKRGHVRRT